MTEVVYSVWELIVREKDRNEDTFEKVGSSLADDLPTALHMSQDILEDGVITFRRLTGGSYILDNREIMRRVCISEREVTKNEWFEN